jgi:hypothetical protein
MKKINFSVMTLATCLIFGAPAIAENMTRNQYTSQKKNIEVEYKSAKVGCDSLAGNTNKICIANAKRNKNVATAELKYKYKPSVKNQFGLSLAKADAEYTVAVEKCDDKAGKVKDACLEEARATQVQQIAAAKVQAKTMKVKPYTIAETTHEERINDDTDSAVAEVKPIGSETIPFEEDIFKDRIRILAMFIHSEGVKAEFLEHANV